MSKSKVDVTSMVDNFLSWRLPDDFAPDCGVEFNPVPHPTADMWPTGTNLLNAEQAHEMISHIIKDTPRLRSRQEINLTAKQLAEAAYWANVDNDPEHDETEVVIQWMPERTSTDGEKMQAGDYLYYEECPEEGVIGPLGSEGFHGRLIVLDEKHLHQTEAAAVHRFVSALIDAFESGFVETETITLAQLHRVMQNHVKDNYQVDLKHIKDEWGSDTAKACGFDVETNKLRQQSPNGGNESE
jgi:hypothetical protein